MINNLTMRSSKRSNNQRQEAKNQYYTAGNGIVKSQQSMSTTMSSRITKKSTTNIYEDNQKRASLKNFLKESAGKNEPTNEEIDQHINEYVKMT